MSKIATSDTLIYRRTLLLTSSDIFWLGVLQWYATSHGLKPLGFLSLMVCLLLAWFPIMIFALYSLFIKISRGPVTPKIEFASASGVIFRLTFVVLNIPLAYLIAAGGIIALMRGYFWGGVGVLFASALLTWLIIYISRSALRRMLNPEYLRADWDKAKALEVFKVTILIVLEAILCSALGAVGIYFAFWPHEILIASLFIACMVIMLLHFRRTTQRTIKDLGFPLKVEMRRFE